MKQLATIFFLLFCCLSSHSQEAVNSEATQREFRENLKEKYNGSDFEYKENKPYEKKEENNSIIKDQSSALLKDIVDFLATIFPYLLALIIIIIVVKIILGTDYSFFNKNKDLPINSTSVLTVQEKDLLQKNEYHKLLTLAKNEGNFRKATKYYYLFLLQKMSDKKLIDFDKDKTNTEYIFELEKTEIRQQFSYLLYIYDYVWYGEFEVNKSNFETIEKKYQSFIEKL